MKVRDSIIVQSDDSDFLKLTLKDNGDLVYGKVNTKQEPLGNEFCLASNVTEYTMDLDENGRVNILYMDKEGVKLLISDSGNEKKILAFNDKMYRVKDIGLKVEGNQTNLFFAFYGKNLNESKEIVHYYWDGQRGKKYSICTIKDENKTLKSYDIKVLNGRMLLLFCDGEKEESCIKICSFQGDRWSKDTVLFKAKGELIDYNAIINEGSIILTVLTKEHSIFNLTTNKFISDFRLLWEKSFESVEEIKNPVLMVYKGKENILWNESGAVFFSNLSNKEIQAERLSYNINEPIKCCEFISNGIINARRVFITEGKTIELIIPKQVDGTEVKKDDHRNFFHNNDEIIRKLKVEVEKTKVFSSKLESKINDLVNQLETKERKLKQASDSLERIEREKVVLEHNNRELHQIKVLYESEKKILQENLDILKDNSIKSQEEIMSLNENIGSIKKEYENLLSKNEQSIKELSTVLTEKERTIREYEKKQGLLSRLFKK